MNESVIIILAVIVLAVYAGLIIRKGIQIRRNPNAPDLQNLRFDLIRLDVDCLALIVFLMSSLFPAWFGLFSDTALGYCTGCFVLISFTLLVSVFVDWFPVRRSYRISGQKAPPFSRFLLKQFVNIFRIEFILVLVWSVFLVLEPTETSLVVKLAIAVLMLLLIRGLLWMIRNLGKKKEHVEG